MEKYKLTTFAKVLLYSLIGIFLLGLFYMFNPISSPLLEDNDTVIELSPEELETTNSLPYEIDYLFITLGFVCGVLIFFWYKENKNKFINPDVRDRIDIVTPRKHYGKNWETKH